MCAEGNWEIQCSDPGCKAFLPLVTGDYNEAVHLAKEGGWEVRRNPDDFRPFWACPNHKSKGKEESNA